MMSKRGAYILAAVLVAEAVLVVAFPARLPRSARALTAAATVVAASAVWLAGRQRGR